MDKHKKKLKVAICFFGHLRSYNKCAPFLKKNLLSQCDYDLFMHTWSTLDHNTQTWHDLKRLKGLTKETNIIASYGHLKGLKIEEQKVQELGNIIIKPFEHSEEKKMSVFGIRAVHYSMAQSYSLCKNYALENQINYDYILFVRPDILLNTPLNIKNLIKNLPQKQIEKSFFTLADDSSRIISGFEDMNSNDLLFFATPSTISNIMENLESVSKDFKDGTVLPCSPEHKIIKLIESSGIKPYRINLKIGQDWSILRSNSALPLKKKIISLRLNSKMLKIAFFPTLMSEILNFNLNISNIFKIQFSIGRC